MISDLRCISCSQSSLVKYGFYQKRQVYRCKSCRTTFTEQSFSRFARHRFSKRVIVFAIALYRYGLSGHTVSTILWKRFRVNVSENIIPRWFRKFSGEARELLRSMGISFTKVWHVDEMWIKAKNQWFYLYAVIDSHNNLITMSLSPRRDMTSTVQCFKQAKDMAGTPEIIVSDGMLAYPRAIVKVFGRGKVRHVQAHFRKTRVVHKGRWYSLSNNRIEGWNSWFRPHYRRMRGFKAVDAMNQFLEMFSLLVNLKDQFWEFLMNW